MTLEEIQAETAIDLSPHGHSYLNPYNGCMMGCPYCYWLSFPGWENRVQVKMNIVSLLEDYLSNRMDDGYLYLGSVCDPFMELEREYRLTGKCLELIRRYRIPLVITTSAASNVILDYIKILKSMESRVIVVAELSRIPFLEAMNGGGRHTGIDHANYLRRNGLEIWATLAPVLPGITDLDCVLGTLDIKIPLYIDRLRCGPDDLQANRILEWISRDYPGLFYRYEDIIKKQDWKYFQDILKQGSYSRRIKTFPFQL